MKKIFQKNSKKEQKWSLEEEFQPEAYEIEQFKPSAEASPEAYGLMESWLTERSASALSSKNSILKITNAYDITADLINTAQKSQNNRKVSFLEEELPEIRPAFINDADLISVNSGDEQWSPNGENAKRSSTYPPASAVKTSLESLEKIRDLDYLIQSPTNDFLEIPSPLDGEIEILFPTEAVPSPISLPNNDCEQTEAQSDSTSSNWLDRDTSSEGLNQVPVSSSKGNSTIVTSSSEEGNYSYLYRRCYS